MQDRTGPIFSNTLNMVRQAPSQIECDTFFKSAIGLLNYPQMLGFEHQAPEEEDEVIPLQPNPFF